ncbi:unnamed protein product [Fraxinus pennsylvanica]|uniref:3-hydroxyacyl-CoA dehydrogenase C-terminal domain-containing protein n=1 Tax=Fraxinus pennsylvanica TaxID=56036 RepID=A0AAD1ZY98_9LAMI|nr:unnamed protein product [Fraxinus pennsylvanica]
MVIEAVIENVSLKQQIFLKNILASNTSTIDLNLIGEKTKSQDRIIGAHFFSPAHVLPLLEIATASSNCRLTGCWEEDKEDASGNCTCFAVNGMATTKFGMPMGPFRVCDLVGFGVAIATGRQFVLNFPKRTYKSMWIRGALDSETANRGFYVYDEKRRANPDPEIKKYNEKAREIAGVTIDSYELTKLSDKDIVEMIFFPAVNEACRVLDEGIAVKVVDLNISAVMHMGFPPYRGGIMFWADTLGSKYICSRLKEWSNLYGGFFKP